MGTDRKMLPVSKPRKRPGVYQYRLMPQDGSLSPLPDVAKETPENQAEPVPAD
jgi:hypothetical protein